MHKCPKCGKDYDGNFCPACGERWQEEKTCPKCGTKLDGDARFCKDCGYSFVRTENKPVNEKKSVGSWIKAHLKILIPVLLAVVVVIVLACSIPACIKAKPNGTYYKVSGGEINRKSYIILKSGKWTDEEGEGGTYKISGSNITFREELFGESFETVGTYGNYMIVLDGSKYISDKHNHSYTSSETESIATCVTDGVTSYTCKDCGYKDKRITPATGHKGVWYFDDDYHWQECSVCGDTIVEQTAHEGSECSVCGYPFKYSLSEFKEYYSIVGVASSVTNLVIPATFNGLPVTQIYSSYFKDCNLESITVESGNTTFYATANCLIETASKTLVLGCKNSVIPTDGSVTSIGDDAFCGCSELNDIVLPDNLISIGSGAFESTGYYNDRQNWEDNVLYIGKYLIEANNNFYGDYTVKDGTLIIADSAFNQSRVGNITLPDGLVAIGKYAFYSSSITGINIPDSVSVIGTYAFRNCNNLTEFMLPDRPISIGRDALSYFGYSLSSQNNWEDDLLYIGKHLVSVLDASTELVIKDGTLSIADYLLHSSGTSSIVIPSSVALIGECAFEASYVYDIYYKGTKAQWNAIEKGAEWYRKFSNPIIHCNDGDIKL